MATYIDLVRTTRLLCGMQGTGPASVEDVQGVEEALVRFVRDAYLDIQNMRESWAFLETEGSFSTTAGTSVYSPLDIFGTTISPLKTYQADSFIITDGEGTKRYLKYSDRDSLERRYLNSDDQKLPTEFTIDPSTKGVILRPIPDGAYNISFRYQRTPEILSGSTDVPSLPLAFHNIIAYKATEKMAVYLSSPEIFSNYSVETSKMLGQLMRTEIPKLRMSHRRFS